MDLLLSCSHERRTEYTDKLNFSIGHAFLLHAYLTELTYERMTEYAVTTGAELVIRIYACN